jgi:hypothetical protein
MNKCGRFAGRNEESGISISPGFELERRAFLKIGAAASASLMFGCSGNLTRSNASRLSLLKGERDWVSSICSLCPSGCATRAYLETGRIVAVAGDPDDPNTNGKMCPIGLSVLNLHNNPDRLLGAFRKNANGRMVPAKGEEILSLLAGRIRQGAALHICGRITPFASRLSRIINAVCTQDPVSGMPAYPEYLNTDTRSPLIDFGNAQTAFLFDFNILEHGHPYVGYVRRITEARQRGLRLVTFSPFLTNTATAGDWIPVRSQAAVSPAALAIARAALTDPSLRISPMARELMDPVNALDDDLLEEESGLSHETIRQLSQRFFSQPGPAISAIPYPSVLLLNLMKGNLNRPGGLLHPGPPILKVDAGSRDIAQILREPGNVVFLHQSNPAYALASEIGPILRSSNRATVVCADSFMSETAEFSDFVLPLASPLETLTITEPLPLGKPFLAAAASAVPPPGSCRSFDDWLVGLATAIGGSAPALNPDAFVAEIISGNSSGRLAPDRGIYPVSAESKLLDVRMPLLAASLKSEIALVRQSGALQTGQYFLTVFEESVQGPAAAPSKWLDEITWAPKVFLHPRRADGIRSGEAVTLTGIDDVSVHGIALLFEGIHPDALAVPMHHGHTGCGRIARGERFADAKDPDASRIFWGEARGINPAELGGPIVTIRKGRG